MNPKPMIKFSRLALALSFLCLIVTLTPANAGTKKKYEPVVRHAPVIGSVTPDSITVTTDAGSKTYTITQFTEITFRGQPSKLADLQPGMSVSVTLGTDPNKLSRINAGDPPAAHK